MVRVIVEADTLFLYGDGTGMHITHSRFENLLSGAIISESSRRAEQLRYWMKGSAFRADFICPPDFDCIAGPHWLGIMGDDGVRMVYFIGADAQLHYERTLICISCRETD